MSLTSVALSAKAPTDICAAKAAKHSTRTATDPRARPAPHRLDGATRGQPTQPARFGNQTVKRLGQRHSNRWSERDRNGGAVALGEGPPVPRSGANHAVGELISPDRWTSHSFFRGLAPMLCHGSAVPGVGLHQNCPGLRLRHRDRGARKCDADRLRDVELLLVKCPTDQSSLG